MHLIEHDLLAFNSSERALHFDGTLCALGDVNVKKMDSGVMFPGWRCTTNKRYDKCPQKKPLVCLKSAFPAIIYWWKTIRHVFTCIYFIFFLKEAWLDHNGGKGDRDTSSSQLRRDCLGDHIACVEHGRSVNNSPLLRQIIFTSPAWRLCLGRGMFLCVVLSSSDLQ